MLKLSNFRLYIFFKLPIAWLAGLYLKEISNEKAIVSIRLQWLNQNPFKSIFWAVQGMAAELSTGVLCINTIKNTGEKVSLLVIGQRATFAKKAVGKILFTCTQGKEIDIIIKECIQSKQGKTIVLLSKGVDEKGDVVSEFQFTWSFKLKKH